jgi:energy-coupling factor transporter ATP-binding protein EcfA2
MPGAIHNPFASARVQPGSQPFLFPPDVSLDELLRKFVATGRRGQIVGRHGAGKSSLLKTLAGAAHDKGQTVWEGTAEEAARLRALSWEVTLFVDGAERLRPYQFANLRRRCLGAGAGLLVTAHRNVGLPTLWRAEPDLSLARRVVDHALGECQCARVPDALLEALFRRHGGNLRLTLFDLYDWFEDGCAETVGRMATNHKGYKDHPPAISNGTLIE